MRKLLTISFLLLSYSLFSQEVTTFSGDTTSGNQNGSLAEARFNHGFGICSDKDGNIYITDTENNQIRKISTDGEVSVLAGTGEPGYKDGPALEAQFNNPTGVCADDQGNIYTAGFEGNRIRKISKEGMVTTVAGSGKFDFRDGNGIEVHFNAPRALCIDKDGNIYIGDCWNYRIRKITPDGVVSTVAGSGFHTEDYVGDFKDGNSLEARFNAPCGVTVDKYGNLFVADANNHRIRKITPHGEVTTIAGTGEIGVGKGAYKDGNIEIARLNTPTELFVDDDGTIYFSDTYNNCIRKIDPKKGLVLTVAGSVEAGYQNGKGLDARFSYPRGITKIGDALFVFDHKNNVIRKIELH